MKKFPALYYSTRLNQWRYWTATDQRRVLELEKKIHRQINEAKKKEL